MSQRRPSLLILIDDISPRGEGIDARRFVERLVTMGRSAQVICQEAGGPISGANIREYPGLASPWRKAFALRTLAAEQAAGASRVMLVLQRSMAETALSLAERRSIPYFLAIEDFLVPGEKLRVSRKWCRGLLAANDELASDLIRQVGLPAHMVHVVHPGLVPGTREKLRRLRCVDSPIAIVGAAGPLSFGGGFGIFLNAARRVLDTGIDAEFVIAGSGEDEIELRRRADRLRISDRVTFAADTSSGDAFWGVLDVYCQPSVVPTVGRGLRLAMAQGVPSIASDVDGLRGLIEPEVTGLRVPANDTNALARAISDLIRSPARAFAMGDTARERIRRDFDPVSEVTLILGHADRCLESELVA